MKFISKLFWGIVGAGIVCFLISLVTACSCVRECSFRPLLEQLDLAWSTLKEKAGITAIVLIAAVSFSMTTNAQTHPYYTGFAKPLVMDTVPMPPSQSATAFVAAGNSWYQIHRTPYTVQMKKALEGKQFRSHTLPRNGWVFMVAMGHPNGGWVPVQAGSISFVFLQNGDGSEKIFAAEVCGNPAMAYVLDEEVAPAPPPVQPPPPASVPQPQPQPQPVSECVTCESIGFEGMQGVSTNRYRPNTLAQLISFGIGFGTTKGTGASWGRSAAAGGLSALGSYGLTALHPSDNAIRLRFRGAKEIDVNLGELKKAGQIRLGSVPLSNGTSIPVVLHWNDGSPNLKVGDVWCGSVSPSRNDAIIGIPLPAGRQNSKPGIVPVPPPTVKPGTRPVQPVTPSSYPTVVGTPSGRPQ